MFKNRFLVVIGVISLLLVTMAVSTPRSNTSSSPDQGGSDFYQRHPDWTWAVRNGNAVEPSASSDYFQRHPELTLSADPSVDMTDYYFRHAALQPSSRNVDLTDYFFRHP